MTDDAPLHLRAFLPADEDRAHAAHDELAAEGFTFLLDRDRVDSFADWCALMDRQARGEDEHPERVPASLLAIDVDGALVGRVSIRWDLNEHLLREGGHVGFGILPAHRRRGYATRTLAQSVAMLADRGVERVLVTCADDNTASAATIERCGGVLADVVPAADGRPTRRYWIG